MARKSRCPFESMESRPDSCPTLAGGSGQVLPHRVSAVVLAAGRSERMGTPKLRLNLDGKSVIRHVIDAALASSVFEVVVVLGSDASVLEQEIPPGDRIRARFNPRHLEGPHSSLLAGLSSMDSSAEAAIVLLGDQPSVSPCVLDSLIAAHGVGRAPLVVPVYRGRRGHPILFDRSLFPELMAAAENEGRRAVILRHLDMATLVQLSEAPPMDVDTPGDYLRLKCEIEISGMAQKGR